MMFRYEWRALLADRLALGALIALCAVLVLGAWNADRARDQAAERFEQTLQENEEKFEAARAEFAKIEQGDHQPRSWQDPRRPTSLAVNVLEPTVAAPPSPLAWLGVGAAELFAMSGSIELGASEPALHTEDAGNPENLLAGRFDPGFVVVFLLPLVALALAFDLIARDRSRGILAMVLSTPAPAWKTYGRRYLVRLIALWSALLAGSLLSAALFADPFGSALTGGFAAWVATACTYAAFWIAVCAAVGALVRDGTAQALYLVACWVAANVAIPALAAPLLSQSVEAPSRAATVHLTREAGWKAWDERKERTSRLLMEHPEMRPPSEDAQQAWRDDLEVLSYHQGKSEEESAMRGGFERAAQDRRARLAWARWLTPAAAAQGALDELSGAGPSGAVAFAAAARAYQDSWNTFFVDATLEGVRFQAADLERVPRFEPASASSASPRSETLGAWSAILAWTVLAVGLALWGLARLSPLQSESAPRKGEASAPRTSPAVVGSRG